MVCLLSLCLAIPLGLRLTAREEPVPTRTISDLRIRNFGPNHVKAGEVFNRQPGDLSALWVKASRPLVADARLFLGTHRLVSNVSGDLITAVVPPELFSHPGTLALAIREPGDRGYAFSLSEEWTVTP